MDNFFDNVNKLFDDWAKGLQSSQKQQGAGASAPSFESVAGTLLGGLGDAIGSAWNGFIEKVNDSNKENIQAGNYTTNPETVHLESPFGDHENLAQKATAKPETTKPETIKPWETENPFGDPVADEKFAQTVFELYDADPEKKQGKKLLQDAYNMTAQYANNVFASYDLLPRGDKSRSPFDAAEKMWKDALEGKKGEYAASGRTGGELAQMLEDRAYINPKQHEENQRQGVIQAAQDMMRQNGDTPDTANRRLAEQYNRLDEIVNSVLEGGALGLNQDEAAAWSRFSADPTGKQLLAAYEDALKTGSSDPTDRLIDILDFGMAQAQSLAGALSYEDAEKYLAEHLPMYGLAKDTQGQMGQYETAYGGIVPIAYKAARGEALTDAEKEAWADAAQSLDFLSDWKMGLSYDGQNVAQAGKLTAEQAQRLLDFQGEKQRQMQDVAGLYSPYTLDPYTQSVFDAYTQTPEGAAKWAEDAQGTKDEEKARDNLWVVTRKAKFAEIEGRTDFQEISKPDEALLGKDRVYSAANGVTMGPDAAQMWASVPNAMGMVSTASPETQHYIDIASGLDEHERLAYNAIVREQGLSAGLEYLRYKEYEVNERRTKEMATAFQTFGESGVGGAIGASALSVPLSIARGVGYLDMAGQNFANWVTGMLGGEQKPVDRYSAAQLPGTLADSARQGVMNQVDWNVNILGQDVDVFDFLYSTGMSGIDSFTAGQLGAALGGLANSAEKAKMIAEWTGAAVLGTGAAQSAMQEVYDQGGNNGTALLMGLTAGINETLFEKISIGKLIENGHKIGEKELMSRVERAMVDIKAALKEAGVNGSEEFFTSIGNGIADYLIRGDERKIALDADRYEQLGLNPDEAMAKAQSDFWASAIMDGVGGILMGLGFGAAENVQSSQYTSQVDKAVGGGFSKEAVESLVSLAKNVGQQWTEAWEAGKAAYADAKAAEQQAKADTKQAKADEKKQAEAQDALREAKDALREAKLDTKGEKMALLPKKNRIAELAAKIDPSKANARQVGELFRLLSETQAEEVRGVMRNIVEADVALQLANATGAMDKAAAEAITDMMEGDNLTPEQVEAIAQNKAALAIVDALFSGENESGDTSSAADAAPSPQGEGLEPVQFEPMPGMEEAEAKQRQAARAGQTVTPAETAEEAPRQERKVPIRVKGQEGSRNITGLGMDGTDVRIDTDAGESISLEDADVDEGTAAVIRAAAQMDDQDAAADMIAQWQAIKGPAAADTAETADGAERKNPTRVLDAGASEAGEAAGKAREAQNFAAGYGRVYDAAKKGIMPENIKSIYGDMLTEEQANSAWRAGRQAYERAEAQAEERNAQEAQAAGYRTVKNAGADAVGVLFDRVRDGIKQGGERVNAMLQMLDRVGREFGMQYRVVDKLENDANGKYVKGTNIVYIALDAEEGAITKAASHEGFHFISQFSPDMAKNITDFVLDKLRQVAGYDIDQRIREVMQQYRDQAGQELTPEEATEEIVADSMLDVIGTRENMEQLMKQSKSTAEKIKEWITNTYQKFKDILNRLAKSSPEVAALKDDVDYLGRISSMWQEGMRQAAEAWRQAQAGYNDSSAALEQNQAVQQYRQEMQGDMTVEDRENSLTAFLAQLFMDTQGPWIQAHMDEYEEGLAKYRQALLEYKRGGVALNVALVRQGLDTVNGPDIRVASYAAEQVMAAEKERAENAHSNGAKYSLHNGEVTLPSMDIDPAYAFKYGEQEQEEAENKIAERENAIKSIIQKNGLMGIQIRKPDGRMEILTPSTRQGVKWQLSYIGSDGVPNMHENYGQTSENHVNEAIHAEQELYHHFANMTMQNSVTMETLEDVQNSNGKNRYSLPSQPRQQADAAESVRDDAELYAQIRQDEDSRAALELLMRMHEQTTQGGENALIKPGAFEKRLGEMVERIKADTATKLSDRAIRKGLRTMYQAMEKQGYSVGEILTYAKEFYQQVLEQAPGALVEMDDSTREAVRILRTNRFQLTPDQKSEIKGTYGSLGDFMRKNFGKLKISNSATVTLADVWRESLNPLNPGLFAEDTAEADMPGIIDAFLENAHEKKFAGEFGANIGAMSTDGALNLMLDFYDVPGAYKQKSEVRAEYQERFDQARALVNQYRQEARQAMNTARAEYQQKYRERLEKDRQSKAEREAKQGVINEIKRNVKPLKTMLVKGTDNRHIPEAMRGAMERMLNNLGVDRAIFSGQEAKELYMKLKKWAADSQLHDAAEAAAYDPDILAKLEWLEEHAGKAKALRDMTMQELEAVRDAVQNMYKMVTEENEIEVNGRKRKVSDLAGAVMGQIKKKKEASSNPVLAFLRKVGFKEMTPVYYAKQVGGTLGDLINDMIRSESDVAFIIKDAKGAFDKAAEKYHLNDWIHDKNHLRFQTSAGDTIELTREQAMTLYAWAERERRNKTQSAAHLRRGGFTYDRNDADVKKMKGVNFTKSHVLSDADVARIKNYLTDEQRGFVETMVKYLSENMAEKGNEASMRMFGWKKFGEKWYFPYPTDRNFRGKNSTDAKGQPDKQIKYMGSSHALTENAMNPLKLDSFTNIWAEHVDEMARYSVMAEKLDNLQRVTNYVVGGLETETGEVFAPESVKKEIERALGQEGAHYLEQLIRDANGNRMGDERGMSDKFISLFKKGSVAANMSVILQQPSAFVRAMSMVNPRYFGKGLHEHGGFKATKERMYANSGVANLKQWGGFDTNTGGSFANTLLDSVEQDGKLNWLKDKIDWATGLGAEKADEITWVYMYSAIEAEIDDRTDYKRGTEDFNKAVARRFDEVMRATQVYDSSMAKSEWMRSTSTMDKIVTSFMAEPTLWINMMMDAALDLKNNAPGARGKAARALGVFVAGTFVNSLLQSIATALRRKKDEGTTIVEKYLSEFASNFTDSLSIEGIASMIPIARDVVSSLQGYDVERADMAVIGNMIDAWRKMEQHMKKGEMPDVDEWMNLAGMAGNMFGVPVRNIYRDVSGIIMNTFGGASSPIGETSGRDILYSVLDETSWNSFVKLWDPSNAAYYDRMEQALIKGDMDKYNELRGYLEETKKVKTKTIDNGLKIRIYGAVDKGLLGEKKAVEMLGELFNMKEDTAFYAIDKYREEQKHTDDEEWEYSKLGNVMEAVIAGKDIPKEEKQKLLDHGYTELELVQAIETEIGKLYKNGDVTKAEAEKMLRRYADMKDADEIYFDFDKWDYQKQQTKDDPNYSKYVDLDTAIRKGKSTDAAIKELTDHGFEMDDIRSHMKDTIGDMYKDGTLNKAQAKEMLKKVAGIEDTYTLYWAFDKWDYQLKYAADRNAPSWNMWRYLREAIDTGKPAKVQQVIKEIYIASDTFGSAISSAITSYGKGKYLELYNSGKRTEAADYQALLLTAYEAAGYSRKSRLSTIQGWVKNQNKAKQEHVKEK